MCLSLHCLPPSHQAAAAAAARASALAEREAWTSQQTQWQAQQRQRHEAVAARVATLATQAEALRLKQACGSSRSALSFFVCRHRCALPPLSRSLQWCVCSVFSSSQEAVAAERAAVTQAAQVRFLGGFIICGFSL